MGMPVTYQIDLANRLIHTQCTGPLTVAEVVDHFRVLEHDPSCPDYVDVLLEVRDGTTVPKSEELRHVVHAIERVRPRVEFGVCAIVARTDALFGMMRMFEVFAEGQFRKTQAFRTIGEAEVWLTIERQPQLMATSVI
jgi:hypothetical protein